MGFRSLHFKILGKRWILRVYSKRDYRKRNGKDSVAVSLLHKRRVELAEVKDDIQLTETLVHELCHSYLYEVCIHSANLSRDEFEEVVCELVAKRGKEITALGDLLTFKVKNLKKRRA